MKFSFQLLTTKLQTQFWNTPRFQKAGDCHGLGRAFRVELSTLPSRLSRYCMFGSRTYLPSSPSPPPFLHGSDSLDSHALCCFTVCWCVCVFAGCSLDRSVTSVLTSHRGSHLPPGTEAEGLLQFMEITSRGPRGLSPNLPSQPESGVSGFLSQSGTHFILHLMLWVIAWASEPHGSGFSSQPHLLCDLGHVYMMSLILTSLS